MAQLYTLDDKLLTEVPEIRVGDKVYPVDNRQKTVMAIQRAMEAADADPAAQMSDALRLAPPLIVSERDVDEAVAILAAVPNDRPND